MNQKNEIIPSLFLKERAITVQDFNRLTNQIADDIGNDLVSPKVLHELYLLTSKSRKIEAHKILPDVVTLNSKIILSTESKRIRILRIVLPHDIKEKEDISVYSPLGIACLGSKEGEYVFLKKADTEQRFFIEKIIFQPEKEKLFHL
jgi:hypothetical protein